MAADPDTNLIDGRSRRFYAAYFEVAADPDTNLIDGHNRNIIVEVSCRVAADPDTNLIDGFLPLPDFAFNQLGRRP